MNPALAAVGIAVVLLTLANVVFTMVLPRRPFGIDRLTLVLNRAVLGAFVALSRVARTYPGQDSVMAPAGAAALVVQLATWALGLVVGFGLLVTATHHSLGDGLLQAITALFTVGATHAGGTALVPEDIAAGALWVVIVALQIAYLPTLYGAFSRREALVALLEARAGLPAWGPELLLRHQLVGITDTLPDLYASWEEWSADVAESHTTYPVLLLFRSPEAWYSWVAGLLAVLDAAAMHLALAPSAASSRARLCLRMGFTLFDRIAVTLGWPVESDPDPDGEIHVSFDEYAEAVAMLSNAGFPVERTAAESWPDFRGWRVNYERAAFRLADWLVAPPAPWSGPRRHYRGPTVSPRRPPQRHPGDKSRRPVAHPIAVAPGARRRSGRWMRAGQRGDGSRRRGAGGGSAGGGSARGGGSAGGGSAGGGSAGGGSAGGGSAGSGSAGGGA